MKKNSIFLKTMAAAIIVAMVGATGCAKAPAPTADGAAKTDAAKPVEEKAPEEKSAEKPKDTPTLTWIMGDPGVVPPDQVKVEAKLDEMSVEKLGVKVKTLYYTNEKTKLALSSGEQWDMVFTCEWFNNYAPQAIAGYYADLTDKVKTVTPALYDTMPEIVWEGTKVDGKVFAIPVKKDYAAEQFYQFDKKLFVDELGMTIPESMKFEDVEQYLKAAKDAFVAGKTSAAQAEVPFKITKAGYGAIDSNFEMVNRDLMIGIPYSAVGTPEGTKIKLSIETPDLTDRLKLLHKWYNEGYINKDAATVDDVGKYSAVKTGQGFYGADAIWSGANGYPVLISKHDGPYLSAASIRGSMNAINANSKYIDECLKYQELVNTNLEYRDTLRYGIEGEHWEKTPEGLAQKTQAGRDGYAPWAFSQGSYSLCTVEAAEGVAVDPKMWEVVFKGYENLIATDIMGFSFDTSNVEAQIAACSAVKEKYWNGLACGTLDPETEIPKFIKEYEAAGIREIITEAQTQLDAFMATKAK